MTQSRSKTTQLNCFSPPIMVATLTIESALAAYTLWRYKMSDLTKLVTATLVMLATFQMAEYFVCTGYGFRAEQWSKLGFIAITTLPPLGLHILHQLADKPARRLVAGAYASMTGFIAFFLTYHAAFIGHQCTGNYVIFQLGERVGGTYLAYYYGWLFISIVLAIQWANKALSEGKDSLTKLQTLRAMIIGYLVFLVPTAVANTVRPETRRGIPSVMCGFAVVFAFILALYVLPKVAELRSLTKASN